MLEIETLEDLLGHPVAGPSWEGMVIETLIAAAGHAVCSFYRTGAGAEIDLVIEGKRSRRLAIEIKRSSVPSVTRGFRQGCADLRVLRAALVYPGRERIPLGRGLVAVGVHEAADWVRAQLESKRQAAP